MLFFDFLYYLIYKFYSDYNEKGAELTSAAIVGGFQEMNVLTIIMLIEYATIDRQKIKINKLLVIVLFIVFQIYTYIRYIYRENHSVDVLESKWLEKTELSRKQTSLFLLLYGIISIISFFGLAIYVGAQK